MMNGKWLLYAAACGALALGSQAQPQSSGKAGKREKQMEQNDRKESPFACNAKALNADERRRWLALLARLGELKQEVRELPDGYGFRFAAEPAVIQEVAEFIRYERLCCPFFDFELKLEREGGPLWLNLRGRKGVKDFIRTEFKIN